MAVNQFSMTQFNLIDSPWLPVRDHDGSSRMTSLLDLFRSPEKWADLDLRPEERISVVDLLV